MPVDSAAAAIWTWLSDTVNYGSLPDWFAGVGATVALLWARKAARAATRQLRILEDDRRSVYAETVAAWVVVDHHGLPVSGQRELDHVTHKVLIHNAGSLPAYRVVVWVKRRSGKESIDFAAYTVLPPTSEPTVVPVTISGGSNRWVVEVGIMFIDAAGRAWIRDTSGLPQLAEICVAEHRRRYEELVAQFNLNDIHDKRVN